MKKSAKKRGASKRPTIYDLAKLAGVSPGTISRVLNNRDKVHPETRSRILGLAREIGMKPQASVRTREIAIVTDPRFPDRHTGYSAAIATSLSYALSEQGIGVLTPSDPERLLPSYFLDGIVAVTYGEKIQNVLKSVQSRIPVVYVDYFGESTDQCWVNSDHYASGYLAAKHFIENGRQKLAFAGTNAFPYLKRLEGFRQAMIDEGMEPNEKLLFTEGGDTSYYNMISRIVKNGGDAVFVPGTSMQAVEGLHILSYVMGKRVPEDIAIIGSESDLVSRLQIPPLTTISEPVEDLAKAAASMIIKLASGEPVETKTQVLPVKLIERESV